MKAIPNILTSLRLVLTLVMLGAFFLLAEAMNGRPLFGNGRVLAYVVLISFVVAAVTDFFDGWLARRWNVTSTLGAILDPIADKVLVCGAILGLLAIGVPGILVPGAVILFREFAVSAMREVLAPRGIKLPVTFLAKTKTAVQLIALTALIVFWLWPAWGVEGMEDFEQRATLAARTFFYVAAAITLWTGGEYAFAAQKALRKV